MRREGGEIPEVAMHGAIYFLTEDAAGPGLLLQEHELEQLKEAVVDRYRAIILRDLDPGNRDKSHFRGMARCVANWRRLSVFCAREGRDLSGLKAEIGAALLRFLGREQADVVENRRSSCLNCTSADLARLVEGLDLQEKRLPSGWRQLCCRSD